MEKIVPAGFVMPALGLGLGTEVIGGSLLALGLLSEKG